LRHADTTTFKIKSLRPQRYSGNIIYYDYETIKQKDASITLEPQNRCAVISLDKAVDLTEATVSFDARGSSGSERIAIVFRDNKMKSNANVEDVILTPFLPTDSWHTFAIKLGDISLPLDKKYITEIRFDTASNFTNNKSESTVYVKNINLGLN
jgi:hypothetical protein